MLVNEDSEGSRIRPLPCLTSGYSRKPASSGGGSIVSPSSSKDSTIKGLEKIWGYLKEVQGFGLYDPPPQAQWKKGSPCSLPEAISVSPSFL